MQATTNQETLIDLFHDYLLESDRERSARAYVGDVRKFQHWYNDTVALFAVDKVTTLHIIEYRTFLQTEAGKDQVGLAPASINRALVSLNVFFKWCRNEGYVERNPMENIKTIQVAAILTPKWLSPRQQSDLIRVVQQNGTVRDRAIILLMLNTGLRVSEVTRLKWCDIRINRQYRKLCVTGKGNKYREIPLNSTARDALEMMRNLNKNCTPSSHIFLNKYGQPMSTRGVFNLVSKYAADAHLEGVTPHTLRHTFCKNAIDLGISINQVAMIAGHSSLDTTKLYTVPSESDLQEAVEKMVWKGRDDARCEPSNFLAQP